MLLAIMDIRAHPFSFCTKKLFGGIKDEQQALTYGRT